MAGQKRFTTYRAAVDSFPQGEQNIGIIKPGRFNGFEKMTTAGGMNIRLTHLGNIPKTDNQGVAQNDYGAIVMPTGIIIHDTDEPVFTIQDDANSEIQIQPTQEAGAVSTRKDLIICEHTYNAVMGGTPATYFVLTGPNSGEIPSIPDPTKQVLIGIVKVERGTTDYSTLHWEAAPAPLPGNLTGLGLYGYIEEYVTQAIEDRVSELNPSATGSQISVQGPLLLLTEHSGDTIYVDPEGVSINITIPANNLPDNFRTQITQDGPGTITIIGESGVTIKTPPQAQETLGGEGATIEIIRREELPNTYNITGNLSSAIS